MPDRLKELNARLAELEADVAAELRAFTTSELTALAQSAVADGEIDDEELEAVLLTRLEAALTGAYTILVLDVTKRIGVNFTVDAVRETVRTALRDAAKGLVPSARAAIAETVATAHARGWSVNRTARRLKSYIALAPSQVERMEKLRADLKKDPVAAAARVGLKAPATTSTGDINRVVERFRGRLIRERSVKVAQHELWRASQAAEHAVWEEATERGDYKPGQVRKHWNDQNDSLVRGSHRGLGAKYPDGIPLSQAFVTTRGLLMYPLDPRGSADNTVGCRCWLTYTVEGEEI